MPEFEKSFMDWRKILSSFFNYCWYAISTFQLILMWTIRWMRCTVYCHYGPDLLKIAINFTDIDHSRVVYPSYGSNWSSRNCRLRPPVAAKVRNETRDWRQRRGGTHSRWFQSPDGFNCVTRTRMNQPRSSGYILLSGVLWKRKTKHTVKCLN